jgi:hypothetical protein
MGRTGSRWVWGEGCRDLWAQAGVAGTHCDAVRMQEVRCDALGSHFGTLVSSDVMRDESKDDGAELPMRARPRSTRRKESWADQVWAESLRSRE